MNIQDIVKILTDSGIEKNEAVIEVKMLIEHFCSYGAKDIIMGRPLDYEKLKIVEEKARKRASTKMPIQYIIGYADFMGSKYEVTPDVLIPRDETEILVQTALEIIRLNNYKNILDIGVGSGCISCSIAQINRATKITAIDISPAAIEVAKINAKNLNIDRIEFIESDLFKNLEKNKKFDLIISNPPYIPTDMILQKEVTFEPKIALYTKDKTGTEFYKKIIDSAKDYLNDGGSLTFELGYGQSEYVQNLFESENYSDIAIQKDLAGIDRVITAKYL